MGIKGLNPLLKKYCGAEYIKKVNISEYANKRIAIDASLIVFAYKARDRFIESLIDFVTILVENSIKPIFVFDGEAPEEKKRERAIRSAKKAQCYARIEKLEDDLVKYTCNKYISQELREINDTKIRQNLLIKSTSGFNYRGVCDYVKNLRSNIVKVRDSDFQILKRVLTIFSIPSVTAVSEGEMLCSQLARCGIVDAVYSRDTDVLACLSPIVLTGITSNGYFYVIQLTDILNKLELDNESWMDLCIMCGTDFNTNIHRIGPMKSYSMIKQYKNIETINDKEKLDITCLNHERVREIFKFEQLLDNIPIIDNGKLDFDSLSKWIVFDDLKISPSNILRRVQNSYKQLSPSNITKQTTSSLNELLQSPSLQTTSSSSTPIMLCPKNEE